MERTDKIKAGGYISKITFNNGETLEIAPNDIIILVGPNNAGKSQSLKDIYALSQGKCPTTVISDIETTKYSGSIIELLNKISKGNHQNRFIQYQVLGSHINVDEHTENVFLSSQYYGNLRTLFVADLDTSARLSICWPQPSITRDAPKQHPIHYAAFNPGYRKWLGENFKQAFGTEIIPNTQFGSEIPLCIGEPVKFTTEYDDEQTRMEAYADILQGYKQVQNQGDGIKSFTGILLYLMLNYYCTYLIDEPEAFLHPPQAKIMGQIIGKTLSEQQQAFISTHSEEIIKGLLETCPDRLKIIRITRTEDANFFSVLSNESFSSVWADPLLKHSNIMSSLFHKTVVLCESDSDCQMYSIIESHLKERSGKYSKAMFIHCGGKQRMPHVVNALRKVGVDVKLIPDMDVLNDKDVFKNIIESFDIDWSTIETDYNIIVSNLHSGKEHINRGEAKAQITRIIDESKSPNLSSNEISKIKEALKTDSKWDGIKRTGFSAIPAGDATCAINRINNKLESAGIFLVPVGELECFIKEVGDHGPSWVNKVLEAYPNLDDPVYNQIQGFVENLGL